MGSDFASGHFPLFRVERVICYSVLLGLGGQVLRISVPGVAKIIRGSEIGTGEQC